MPPLSFSCLLQQLLAILVLTILNLVDGVAYGRLIFPHDQFYVSLEFTGISLFLFVCALSQGFMTWASGFGVGVATSPMVESIPFIHAICRELVKQIVRIDNNKSEQLELLFAATWLSMVFLGVLTGVFYGLLVWSGLHKHIHKLPRTVLVGSLTGIGGYLGIQAIKTGGLFKCTLVALVAVFVLMFERVSPFIAPLACTAIAVIFWLVVAVTGVSIDSARQKGWLPDVQVSDKAIMSELPKFGSLKSLTLATRVISLIPWSTITGGALFNLIHVNLNVPNYARITGLHFDLGKEALVYGLCNLLTGIFCGLPSYMAYTNSVLFLKSGATTRATGYGLALVTFSLWLLNPGILCRGLNLIPVPVILFLLIYLALSLLEEGLIKSYALCLDNNEYAIIMLTGVSMSLLGFLPGLTLSLLLSFGQTLDKLGKTIDQNLTMHRLFDTEHRPTIWYSLEQELSEPMQTLMNKTLIITCTGPLFFGNSTKLAGLLVLELSGEDRLNSSDQVPLLLTTHSITQIIVDLTRVEWIDMNIVEVLLQSTKNRIILVSRDRSLVSLIREKGSNCFTSVDSALDHLRALQVPSTFNRSINFDNISSSPESSMKHIGIREEEYGIIKAFPVNSILQSELFQGSWVEAGAWLPPGQYLASDSVQIEVLQQSDNVPLVLFQIYHKKKL